MQQINLLPDEDRAELERLMSIIHSETLSTASKLEQVAELLARHGLIIQPPAMAKSWTASDIAKELGVSAQALGKLATAAGVKNGDEFGGWQLSTANGKQVQVFVYNEAGRQRLRKLWSSKYER